MIRRLVSSFLMCFALMACAVDVQNDIEPTREVHQQWATGWTNVGSTLGTAQYTHPAAYADVSASIIVSNKNTDNKTYFLRTGNNGSTVVTDWTLVPGQGTMNALKSPAITRGNVVLLTNLPYVVFQVTSTGAIRFTKFVHYFATNAWNWTGTWTTVPNVATGNAPTATYHPSTGRIYLFYIRSTDQVPMVTYTGNNGSTWSGPYVVGGSGVTSNLSAVTHTIGTWETIELVRITSTGATQWTRMIDSAVLDSSDWNGWWDITAAPTPVANAPATLATKNNQYCAFVADYNDSYRAKYNCTTDTTNWGASWTAIPGATDAWYGALTATSFCATDSTQSPSTCTGTVRKLVYQIKHESTFGNQLQVQVEDQS